jgi:hypothetical protein
MAIAVWRLLRRADLDDDPSLPRRKQGFREKRGPDDQGGRNA